MRISFESRERGERERERERSLFFSFAIFIIDIINNKNSQSITSCDEEIVSQPDQCNRYIFNERR